MAELNVKFQVKKTVWYYVAWLVDKLITKKVLAKLYLDGKDHGTLEMKKDKYLPLNFRISGMKRVVEYFGEIENDVEYIVPERDLAFIKVIQEKNDLLKLIEKQKEEIAKLKREETTFDLSGKELVGVLKSNKIPKTTPEQRHSVWKP